MINTTQESFRTLTSESIESKISALKIERQRMLDGGYSERREEVLKKDKEYQSYNEQRDRLEGQREKLMRDGFGFSLTDTAAMLAQSLFLDNYWELKELEEKMISRSTDGKFAEEHRKWKLLYRYENTLDSIAFDREISLY